MAKEFTIRKQVFSLLNTNFHIYDEDEKLIGYSRQKAFKLKEDIRVFTDETMEDERLSIKARAIIDFSAAYDIFDSKKGVKIGALKRKGWASILRDTWIVMDVDDEEVGKIEEDSAFMALLRRFLSNLIPQKFHMIDSDDNQIATFRQHFNPFVFKLTVSVEDDCTLPAMLVLAAGILLSAIEGRQK